MTEPVWIVRSSDDLAHEGEEGVWGVFATEDLAHQAIKLSFPKAKPSRWDKTKRHYQISQYWSLSVEDWPVVSQTAQLNADGYFAREVDSTPVSATVGEATGD